MQFKQNIFNFDDDVDLMQILSKATGPKGYGVGIAESGSQYPKKISAPRDFFSLYTGFLKKFSDKVHSRKVERSSVQKAPFSLGVKWLFRLISFLIFFDWCTF